MTALAGFLDALNRRGLSLSRFRAEAKAELQGAVDGLHGVFAEARNRIDSGSAVHDPETVIAATRILARGMDERERDLQRLHGLLRPQLPPSVQVAALAALRRSSEGMVGELLLGGWQTYGPALREEVSNTLLSRQEWTSQLLNAIKSGRLAASDLGAVQQQKLLTHSQISIRDSAIKLFGEGRADRQQLLDQYRKVAALNGDSARGRELYRVNCSPCHRFRGEGQNVGPELEMISDKPLETLLTAILDPNQAVEWRYVNYNAVTKSGHEVGGIIAAETPVTITLRMASGQEETLLRSDLTKFESTKLSLMPEGFEQSIKPQDMADLIAFLRTH
jgi:putative heme-binding domain-containing protein